MNTFIKYWSYLVENEDKEISFETFLKEKSNLFEAKKKWPEDYLKQAKNLILNSPLGKSDWYAENFIDQDLKTFENEFETLRHKGDFTLGFFPSIIKWFIEYSGSDKNKYQEFIEKKLDNIIRILTYIVSQKDDEVSQFHEINKKDKDENGNPRVYRFKKLKDKNWVDFEKEIFQKYSDEISKSVELKNDFSKGSNYEIVPIYSYEELNKKFGGNKTGYKGKSEWCHTNGRSTYNSWSDNGKYMFIVFAKKGWENIKPPNPKTTNAFDDYGTSLIACLFDTDSKELLHSTLRWNHIIDPAKTKIGASVDNAFKNKNDLMNTVGIDLTKDLDEYFNKFREINKPTIVTIGGKDFGVKYDGSIGCSKNQLTSLEGSPKEVAGSFDCSYNNLTSLKGAPQKVGRYFDCGNNYLTSLKGAPQKVSGSFWCYDNKLISLEGAPQEVSGSFNCAYNKLTSLEGAPQKVGEEFNCSGNKLTSLEGAPQKVSGSFYCSDNELTSLKGAPQKVSGSFDCSDNELTSLKGAPMEVSGNFDCSDNDDLPEYKIKAYEAYLKLSDVEKASLTKDNHYYPTEEWENKFK
jgi:hypothetical protein